MSPFILYVGSKNYSSWSLRPWLAMKIGNETRGPRAREARPLDELEALLGDNA